ncbi:MAG: ThiF family adenylyltransferase [Bacteroidia bacterium]|jgi:hypothetical protein|nr:ThiF family adenylyltransferase [Bacteroidia bacterium]
MKTSLDYFVEYDEDNNQKAIEPLIFNVNTDADLKLFRGYLQKNRHIRVQDTITLQIRELIKCRFPSLRLDEQALISKVVEKLEGRQTDFYGNWIYYPWLQTLVHTLKEDEFIEVRTNRNKLKITKDEQEKLSTKCIGVVGLSVGQSVAITLVMERLCGKIKIADFDQLELSNLNRLRAGIQHLGTHKVILAAREIAEIDPYIEVEVFENGLTTDNLDNFFHKLDLLVEVCDGLSIKLKSRVKAKELKIPVVMDTNDRGMIDIERFDLEPKRPIMHGLLSEEEIYLCEQFTPEQRIETILKLVNFKETSDRLKDSMMEIGKSITTWPQLASSVMLGAGTCTDCCRRILLDQPLPSGRFYIDTLELIK